MTAELSTKLQKYLTEIDSQSSKVRLDGYYPANAVIDAFSKGEDSGAAKATEDFKDGFIRATMQMFLYGTDVVKILEEKQFPISGAFINPFRFKVLLATEQKNTWDDNFIELFYDQAFIYEDKFCSEFGKRMHISFIQDNDLNEDELKSDGYIWANNE